MPTAPKLVAALFFAVLAYFTCDLIKPLLPEGTAVGLFSPLTAALGFIIGWRFAGTRIGNGTGRGFGVGLAASVLITFWGVVGWSGYEMLRRSIESRGSRYDDPVEAVQGMVQFGVDYVMLAATPGVIGTIVVGGLIGGWLTEWVARRGR